MRHLEDPWESRKKWPVSLSSSRKADRPIPYSIIASRRSKSPHAILQMQAIWESMLPRQAGDKLPQSGAGILCSLSEKLDSLVGLFAAGQSPGASDIYGLRRVAYGVIEVDLLSLASCCISVL